ncbi:MarR family transcriptional regulator [Saxibacter everestensis]|uniref:MarR family transcriptional regulator n=1 Tax=Saxibacter everestensis TaxID=2909229 RepID=A0ABY8QRQ1_9MICO|nr:MarR family transcriptional regulator [Brevibacteriaceae bacterium ZFBP1038]
MLTEVRIFNEVYGWEGLAMPGNRSTENLDTVEQAAAADAMSADAPATSVDLGQDVRQQDFGSYLTRVAEARYVMRKVLRILNESSKAHGLDALEHQALVQIAGTPSGAVAIHALADRLDIVPAFGSRIVKQLESKSLIERSSLEADKRVTLTSVTEKGLELLRQIDESVHYQMAYFQRGLNPRDRASALAIFAFYVGEPTDSVVAEAIRGLLV